ncbi:phosphopantetheine-binding protein [Streptomyces sp. NPDC012510]|uniref:acyl carrier protein n=1 Tax=Streptomyces sp. NPDC012510 TaxID=3364838 RepID=UPI0036E757E9
MITTTTTGDAPQPGPDSETQPRTAESLGTWLVSHVAAYTRLSTDEIDRTAPLTDYGLDSLAALSLCGDIEDEFDLVVEPTVAWDHPTVEALAAYLLDELGPRSEAA